MTVTSASTMNLGVGIRLNSSSGNARWLTVTCWPRADASACRVCSASVAHGQLISDHTVTIRDCCPVMPISLSYAIERSYGRQSLAARRIYAKYVLSPLGDAVHAIT